MEWDESGSGDWPEETYSEESFQESDVEQEFASEALWTYHTALDERVCGRCAPLEGVMFTLDEINEQFPSNENYGDIIFVNMDDHGDKCRCCLTKEPGSEGTEGGEEETVDGRGTPLQGIIGRSSSAPSLISLMRHPTQTGFARFGIRSALVAAGLTWLIFPILGLLWPLLMSAIQIWNQAQIKAEVERVIKEAEAKNVAMRTEALKAAMQRESQRAVIP